MATGMAIMGLGGGAMIGAPLADVLMKHFATPTSVGVWETFVALGIIYLIAMLAGAFTYRIPAPGWKPHGWILPAPAENVMITQGHVHVNRVHHTPQFWLLWAVLCLNVSAGIGIIGMASPMLQEVFGGKLIGLDLSLQELTANQKVQVASIGAGFAGLLSLFNNGGRIFRASLSDKIGRKRTYHIFFAVGLLLYGAAALSATSANLFLFVALCCIIMSMYGGGFATIPAYLADMFGTQFVRAIHGRLLTAWSTAGILGPVLVNYIREFQLALGVAPHSAYNITLYVLAGLLLLGFLCNLLVRPVAPCHFMTDAELQAEWSHVKTQTSSATPVTSEDLQEIPSAKVSTASWIAVGIGWTTVGIPLAWGILQTVEKAAILFH
jgi:MFS family permease